MPGGLAVPAVLVVPGALVVRTAELARAVPAVPTGKRWPMEDEEHGAREESVVRVLRGAQQELTELVALTGLVALAGLGVLAVLAAEKHLRDRPLQG